MAVQYNEDVLALIDAKLEPLNAERQQLHRCRESVVKGLQGQYTLATAAVTAIIADVRALVPQVTADWKGKNDPVPRVSEE